MRTNRLLGAMALVLSLGASIHAEPVTEAVAKANLAKVPAADPAPTQVPQIVPALRGQHPRLLFTAQQLEKLKPYLASDPILKKTYADNAAWAKRFTLAKAWQPTNIVRDDTSAITMVKSWPVFAYTYSIDHDPSSKQAIIDILNMMLQQPYWADTAEFDSNMGAGENMLMVGLLFDAICNDLEPGFRAKMAENILVHCRRMYYLGHQKLCLMPIKYWQADPANNHRWHRDAGLAACLLAIADEKSVESGYILQQFKQEMDFVMQWYPPDGDCHEGAGYQTFGFFYLALAADMMDRVMGTTYLEHPGFRNAFAQQLYYEAPGRQSHMSFGDDMNGEGVFDNLDAAFFLSPRLSRDKNIQAALTRSFLKHTHFPGAPTRAYNYPWALLTFYDPTVGEGDYKAVPTVRLFPDLGAASMRDTWEDNAVCFTFKCGPYGGYKLNEYAHAHKDEKGNAAYVNIAHDDPDANSFAMGMSGDLIFHPGLYSLHKLTSVQNAITVNDKGQINEGADFTQPVPGVDMRRMSYLTGWKNVGGRVIVEGEAAAAYPDSVLQRFRRSVLWMPGEYVLVLDDLRSGGKQRITWRGTVEKGQFEDPANGKCYVATKAGKRVDFQILANREFNGAIDYAFLDGRFGSKLMQQFQFSLDSDAVKFACLMDPWKKKPTLTLKESGDTLTLNVRGDSFNDTWTWTSAKDATTPSKIAGSRGGAELIALTEADKAPADAAGETAKKKN